MINSNSKNDAEINRVLDFWFDKKMSDKWFNSNEQLDKQIRGDFYDLWLLAIDEKLEHWQHSAFGVLALIIVLDQLPLNMFRNNKKAYLGSKKAIYLTKFAVKNKLDINLIDEQKKFMYMPLMHSENILDQKLCVELFEENKLNTTFAKHHYHIMERFGRFPHRNKILDRKNTAQELKYLSSKEAFLG